MNKCLKQIRLKSLSLNDNTSCSILHLHGMQTSCKSYFDLTSEHARWSGVIMLSISLPISSPRIPLMTHLILISVEVKRANGWLRDSSTCWGFPKVLRLQVQWKINERCLTERLKVHLLTFRLSLFSAMPLFHQGLPSLFHDESIPCTVQTSSEVCSAVCFVCCPCFILRSI